MYFTRNRHPRLIAKSEIRLINKLGSCFTVVDIALIIRMIYRLNSTPLEPITIM